MSGWPFETIEDVKRANAACGHHFFDATTLRFFRSRIGRTLYAGRFFVTSEQFEDGWPRLYTVREAMPDGSIETLGKFQGFETREAAVAAVRRLVKAFDELDREVMAAGA